MSMRAVSAQRHASTWIVFSAALAVVNAASAAAAGEAPLSPEAGSDACAALADKMREALAGPAPPVPALPLIDPGYDVRERNVEDELRSTAPTAPMTYAGWVTPACRDQSRRDDGSVAVARDAAVAWTSRPKRGWIERGRIMRCALDLASRSNLKAWMADPYAPAARAICASEVAARPGEASLRDEILANAVRTHHGSVADWEIDEAIVAVANTLGTVALREQLVPVLAAAHAHGALGYDRLRDAVCTDDGMMSSRRAQVCSTVPTGREHAWRRSRQPWMWMARGGATALYAGMVAGADVEGKQGGSRSAPTLAGVLGGAVAGPALLNALTADRNSQFVFDDFAYGAEILGTMVAGAVIGGVVAHEVAFSPHAAAAVTAVGMAPPYLAFLSFTFD